MKSIIRMLCICLALCLAMPALGEEAQQSAAPTVRVWLRRLGLTDRADLTLDGVYTAQLPSGVEMSFPKGSQVTVLVRSGELYLFYEGMSLHAGTALQLIRNASESTESEGIRFVEGGNFYPGDLTLTLTDQGLLRPVCTLSVEDYLLGVVPYEMSNSFPLEALKAQAVCARTYALRADWHRGTALTSAPAATARPTAAWERPRPSATGRWRRPRGSASTTRGS